MSASLVLGNTTLFVDPTGGHGTPYALTSLQGVTTALVHQVLRQRHRCERNLMLCTNHWPRDIQVNARCDLARGRSPTFRCPAPPPMAIASAILCREQCVGTGGAPSRPHSLRLIGLAYGRSSQ